MLSYVKVSIPFVCLLPCCFIGCTRSVEEMQSIQKVEQMFGVQLPPGSRIVAHNNGGYDPEEFSHWLVYSPQPPQLPANYGRPIEVNLPLRMRILEKNFGDQFLIQGQPLSEFTAMADDEIYQYTFGQVNMQDGSVYLYLIRQKR